MIIQITLANIVRTADQVGFDSIWVMDHFFQIRGPAAQGADAGRPDRARIHRGKHRARATRTDGRRHPLPGTGAVGQGPTTLDVLWAAGRGSGRRGVERPRVEGPRLRLPTAQGSVRVAGGHPALRPRDVVRGERHARRVHRNAPRGHPRQSPQSIGRPRIPILVGGGGARKTLRLVAQYADACNVFGRAPEFVRAKSKSSREHCERLGRPYDEIERTVLTSVEPGRGGDRCGRRAFRRARRGRGAAPRLQRSGRRRHVATRAHRLGGDGAASLSGAFRRGRRPTEADRSFRGQPFARPSISRRPQGPSDPRSPARGHRSSGRA